MAEHATEPFHAAERQREANRFGMLIFLSSEFLLFGGIFAAAMALRLENPDGYRAAASHLRLGLGTANTAILLTSSLFAALAVEAMRGARPRRTALWLGGAALLGAGFLGIKGTEYAMEYREGLMPGTATAHFSGPAEQIFMNLYFAGTGLHALHVTIGIAVLLVAAALAHKGGERHAMLVGNAALYWHLVDIVWIFLYPTLYLAGVG